MFKIGLLGTVVLGFIVVSIFLVLSLVALIKRRPLPEGPAARRRQDRTVCLFGAVIGAAVYSSFFEILVGVIMASAVGEVSDVSRHT